MADLDPSDPLPIGTKERDRPIVWQAAASLALHLGVLGFLLWPALKGSLDAASPPAIDVELVTLPSEEPSVETSSAEPSEEASSEAPAAEPSAEAASAAPSEASAEETSAAREQPSETASPSEPPPPPPFAEETAETAPPPVPMSRPLVISVGTARDEAADSSSSAAEDGITELTVETGDTAAGETAASGQSDSPPLPELGELQVAQSFYLAQILGSPAMAKARDALETLPHDKRLSQTCNIEAVGQVASAGRGFRPDAVIADAFTKSTIAGTRITANGAIFRSDLRWYALAFECTLTEDLSEVASFTYRLGPDVTRLVTSSQAQ